MILAVCFQLKQLKKQPEKNSGFNRIRTHDLATSNYYQLLLLRTFARKSSNIDFFIKLLLQLCYELLLSETQKNWGGHQLQFGDIQDI